MANKQLSKEEIRKIAQKEIKDFVSKELDNEVRKIMRKTAGAGRGEVVDIVKKGLESLYKYMWIRRDVWKGDIK